MVVEGSKKKLPTGARELFLIIVKSEFIYRLRR